MCEVNVQCAEIELMEYITEYILVRGEQNIYFINIYFPSKKIVVVILSDPPLKGAIPDSQRYP